MAMQPVSWSQIRRYDLRECLIGLDVGTSALKGVLLSISGRVVAQVISSFEYNRNPNGIVEFDADLQYMQVACALRRLFASLPTGSLLAGISMSFASGNTLLVDSASNPIMPAISWMDTRATDEITGVFGAQDAFEVHNRVGWPLTGQFPLAHLAWLRRHRPDLLERANKVCMTSDYILHRLTDRWGIDPSTATTSYLQNQHLSRWHLPYLSDLGISEDKLPPILPSTSRLGGINVKASIETGLPFGTPIVLGAFDHPSAARGAGVLESGRMLLSCGTSWVGFYPTEDRQTAIQQSMLIDPFLRPRGPWGAMFSVSSVGVAVDRIIQRYISTSPDRYPTFDRLAESAPPGAGGLIIDPFAEMSLIDLSMHSQEEIARAIMEGTCYLIKSKMEALREAGITATSINMAGGPSDTHPWPQILCDVLGMELTIINGSCAGAVGAAVLAGIGVELFNDEKDAFQKMMFEKSVLSPDMETSYFYQKRFEHLKRHER
jgi:sugar (pentulose or hexulose) kinase